MKLPSQIVYGRYSFLRGSTEPVGQVPYPVGGFFKTDFRCSFLNHRSIHLIPENRDMRQLNFCMGWLPLLKKKTVGRPQDLADVAWLETNKK